MTTTKKLAILLLGLAFAAGVYLRHSEGVSGATTARGPLTVVVVEDTQHRTREIGATLTDPDVLSYVARAKINWRVVDQAAAGSSLAEVQFALDVTKNGPLPALVLREGDGKPQVRPLPDAKTLLALLKSQS